MAKVLVVDDDPDISSLVSRSLEQDGAVCDIAENFITAKLMIETYPYELLVLDLGLPDGNGALLCEPFRKQNKAAPVIILTGESSSDRKLQLFQSGAQDYVTKPFSTAEMRARVRSVLRRYEPASGENCISLGDLRLLVSQMNALCGEVNLELDNKEFAVLNLLVSNKDRPVRYAELLEGCWGRDDKLLMPSLRVTVSKLRSTLRKVASGMDIETLPRLGYKLSYAATVSVLGE